MISFRVYFEFKLSSLVLSDNRVRSSHCPTDNYGQEQVRFANLCNTVIDRPSVDRTQVNKDSNLQNTGPSLAQPNSGQPDWQEFGLVR